jgi:hypothetical protein
VKTFARRTRGFGSSPACGRRNFVRLLRFLLVGGVGGDSGPPMLWPCIMPGPIDSMFFLHSVHVGNHRFPHIHVGSPE